MIVRTLAVALLLAAAPACAAPAVVADKPDVAKSCVKHQVHTPAGKMVHNAPVYFCKTKAETVAANDKMARGLNTTKTARD